eukprot:14345453-Alexandrium_andersonii.AAC.1
MRALRGAHCGSHGGSIGLGLKRAVAVGRVLKKSRPRGNGDQSAVSTSQTRASSSASPRARAMPRRCR